MKLSNVIKGLITCLITFFSIISYADEIPIIENNEDLATLIIQLSEKNDELKKSINLQNDQLDNIINEQNTISSQITHVQNTLTTLDEQVEWLSFSTALGETLRQQLLQLPEKPKPQALDADIADAKVRQLNDNNLFNQLQKYPNLSGSKLDNSQIIQYRRLIREQSDLLKKLIAGYDSIILELTKLKIANRQLIAAIEDVTDAAHRYFFWVADVNPITKTFPLELARDVIFVVASVDTLSQLYQAGCDILQTPQTLFLLIFAIVLVVIHIKAKSPYTKYLDQTSLCIGKVTQDSFSLTLKVIVYSLFMALPVPILWGIIGYVMQMNWQYPVVVALGYGVNAAAPILWVFIISAHLASPNGLFIAHFGWSKTQVRSAMKYYQVSVWVVIPLMMLVMGFDQYNNHQFSATIGRFCFILLCFALVFMTNSIHRAGLPLYIDKKGSGDNLLSRILWVILLAAPWVAILTACLGYLSTTQVLLGRLEFSVIIWFVLLVVYFLIRRWMWIQKRRIEFDRAKQRRIERLAQRAKNEEDNTNHGQPSLSSTETIEEPIIDLDVISAQSLHLVRSIINMIALISMILLWSELHSAFAFMENIKLWSTKIVINGNEIEQNITLSSFFIAILIMMITVQLVKNLPALLELGILQHLDLTPGTGYAISTITKYIILIIGSLIAFSFIGIDWSKIQWLIAALGVGLGFGLQEIFANFISGLIMLFEKPVRIGDTVTIRDLTGTITKINTRATTIVDWDRKEIVMPNKAFITEQLINWSLSDSITRIVLTIPATIDADSQLVINILKKVAKECEYVLDEPEPQVYLVDIQEGIQLYELRVFASEMSHRMPLRSGIQQLIIQEYRKHALELPFPPLQTNLESFGRKNGRRIYTIGTM